MNHPVTATEEAVEAAFDRITDLFADKGAVGAARELAPLLAAPYRMISIVDGVSIGWDSCGGCMRVLRQCDCPNGPTPPPAVARFRLDSEQEVLDRMAARSGLSTPVRSPEVQNPDSSLEALVEGADVPAHSARIAKSILAARDAKKNGPNCKVCNKAVTESNGDPNDDGTHTCHACQAGAAARA